MAQRYDDVSAMDEIRGEIGFVLGLMGIEIAELLEDDGRVVRDKNRAGRHCVHDLGVS